MKLPDYAFKGLEPLRPTDMIPKGSAMFTTEDLSDFIDRGNDLLLTGNRPTDLQSLRETRGSTQSKSERWGRGLKKAGANAGGIIAESGVVLFNLLKAAVTKSPGATPALAAQGADFSFFEEVINSQAQKDIDEWSEGVRQRNPHYLTQAQQDYTTTQKVFKGDSGFWSDAVLGGFGFLAGTVATEFLRIGALKGLGSLAKIARGAKAVQPARKVITEAAKSTAKGSDVLKMLRNAPASQTNSAGSAMNTVLSVATSTAGESALEARMFREHAVEELKEQFKQINFREPTQSEIYELEQMANSSGNAVFALNMATVGMSNAIMLGKMLGKGIKVGKFGKFGGDGIDVLGQAGKRIDNIKGRFALGRVAIEEGKAVVKLTKFQKALRAIGKGAIKPLSEGAEEGLQYAYETGAVDYLLSKTNLDALDNVSLLSSITNEGLAQTLGTQEGREQVLVGALLGFLGIPGAAPGSVVDMIRAGAGTDAFSKRLATLAGEYNKWSETGLHANMASAVQQHEYNKRKMNAQDLMTMHDNKAAQTFGFFASRNALGLLDSEVDKIAEQIMAMDNETFAETYDKDIVLENAEEAKKQLVTSLKDSATSFKEAHKIAKRINNNNYETQQDKDFVDGLAFIAYNIKDLDTREGQLVDRIKEIFPAFNQASAKYAADLINEDKGTQLEQRQQLTARIQNVSNQSAQLKEQIETLKSQIQSLPESEQAQVTSQLNNLVKGTQELDRQVEEAKAQIKQIDESIAQSQATATASREARRQDSRLPDYNNEYDSFAEAVTEALNNYIDTQNAIESKADTNVEADELFQELVDLGRIAKKREALIAQYNYFTQSTGKESMLELKQAMLEALHERQKYDFVRHYLIDKMAKENGLYDKADFDTALREAMALLKNMEDIGYSQLTNVIDHNIYLLEKDNQTLYFSYVVYADGKSEFYQVDENAKVVKDGISINDIDAKLKKYIEENTDTTQIDAIRRSYNDSWVNGVSRKLTAGLPVSIEEIKSPLQLLSFLNIQGVDISIEGNNIVIYNNDTVTEYELIEANYDNINKTITELFSNYFDIQVEQDNINKYLPEFLNSEDYTGFSDSIVQADIENSGLYNYSERMEAARQHFEDNKAILLQYLMSNYTSKNIAPEQMPAVIDNARKSIDNFNVADYFNDQEAYQTDYFILLGQQLRGSEELADKTDEEVLTENPDVVNKEDKPGTNTETSTKTSMTLDDLTNVKDSNIQGGSETKSKGSNQQDDVPQNTTSTKSYALRNILEVFTRSYTQEDNKKASEVVRKVLKTKFANADSYKPAFRVVVGDVKEGKLDLGEHYHKDKDGTKQSGLKQQKGFVAKDRTVFLHLELQDPDTNEFVRIGQMLDPNRFKDAQGNDLDLTNADNIRRIYPNIDAQDIIPVSEGAVKMVNFTQSLTNYLNDEVANLEVGTPIPEDVFEEAASQAGVVMGADQLREFVFPNDKKREVLRETARKAPEQFSIARNYPPDEYGFSVTDDFGNTFNAVPFFRGGMLVSVFAEVNGVLESTTASRESRDKLIAAYSNRESRNNESNDHIMIVNSRGKLQTVDIIIPGQDPAAIEDFNQKYTNILVENGDFGESKETLGLFTVSMDSALRQKKDNQIIRLETDDGTVQFEVPPSNDLATLNVSRNTNQATKKNFVEFSLERFIRSSGNLVYFTPIKYKFNYINNKIEMSVNRNGKTVILNRYDTFDVEQVLKDINTDIQNNADTVKETLNTVGGAKIVRVGGGQDKYDAGVTIANAEDVAITNIKSLSFRNAATKPKDYITAMLRTDVAAEAVIDENGQTVRLMPNNVFAEFGLTEPIDADLANTGKTEVDITDEDTSQEYDPNNKEDVTEEDVTEDIETTSSIEERRREEFKGNIVEEVLVYKQTVRGKEFEVYEEKYDKNSDEFIRYVKREDGSITSTTKEERAIFDKETTKKEFIKDVTEDWIDIELQAEINDKYDAEYVDAVKKGEMTREQAMKALENVGRKESAAYTELANLEGTQQPESTETVEETFSIEEELQTIEVERQADLQDPLRNVPKNVRDAYERFYSDNINKIIEKGQNKTPDFLTLQEAGKKGLLKFRSEYGGVGSDTAGFKYPLAQNEEEINNKYNTIYEKKIEKGEITYQQAVKSIPVDIDFNLKRRLLTAQYQTYNKKLSASKEEQAKKGVETIQELEDGTYLYPIFDSGLKLVGYIKSDRVLDDGAYELQAEYYEMTQGELNNKKPSITNIISIEEANKLINKETTVTQEPLDLNKLFDLDSESKTVLSMVPTNNESQIQQSLGVDIDTLLKNGTVKYTDETGTECAKAGMASAKFTQGSKWSLVKDLKNMPTHEQGGVNLTFADGGFMVGKVKAEKGLVFKTDPPKTTQDSINFMADKIIQYELARGSAQGTGIPKYKNPYYKDLLVNKIYPEVKKIMPNASAQEAAEAMDFIFNSGFDQTTFKIDKDPRGYALQEYYRKYDRSKLDSDGNWAGRKNAPYSFDDEYNNTIAKLPENERRILMNKGRDWYLQNIERGKGKINENLEAYKNTWYGRIWNTNDFRPFNANDPRFIYKKK